MERPDENSPSFKLLIPLFLGVVTGALDIAMVGPGLSSIQDYFELDARIGTWIIGLFALFTLVGVPAMAWIADNIGKRRSFLISTGLFVAGALTCFSAPTVPVLFAGRILQGLGAAGVFPVASAVVGDVVAPSNRGKFLGILGSVFGVAFLVGPAASGILLLAGWRYIFLFSVPIGLGAFLLGWRMLPKSDAGTKVSELDVPGLLLMTGFVGLLAFALNGIDNSDLVSSLGSTRFIGFFAASMVALTLFVIQERRASNPIVRPGLFSFPGVRLTVLLAAGAGICEAALVFTAAFAVSLFEVDASTAGFMFLPLAGSIAVASPLLGRLLDSLGSGRMVVAGSLILTAGLLIFANTDTLLHFYAGSVLIGIGQASLLGSTLNYIMLGAAPERDRATAQGFITLSLNLGIVVGSAIIGAIAASADNLAAGYATAFGSVSIVAALMAGAGFLVRRSLTPGS